MPTYAYACKDCTHSFDIQQSFSDDSLTVCPVCSGVLRKKFNSVGVVFKGSGFYRNDSRSTSSTTTPADSGSATESGSSSGSGSSSESASKGTEKPAASSTSTPSSPSSTSSTSTSGKAATS